MIATAPIALDINSKRSSLVACEAVRTFTRATVTLASLSVSRLSWPTSLVVSRFAKTTVQLLELMCCDVRCRSGVFVLCDPIWNAKPVPQSRFSFPMRKIPLNALSIIDKRRP